MEAANRNITKGIAMPTAVPDPPRVGKVKAAPKTGKGRPRRTAGTMARRATQRASAGKNERIQTEPDRAGESQIGVKDHTTP